MWRSVCVCLVVCLLPARLSALCVLWSNTACVRLSLCIQEDHVSMGGYAARKAIDGALPPRCVCVCVFGVVRR